MSNGSLQDQLDALRTEIRALGNSVMGIRREDFTRTFIEQIRPILMERIDRALDEVSDAEADASKKEASRSRLVDLVDRTLTSYQESTPEALEVLEGFQSEIDIGKPPFNERWCSRLAQDLVRQIRSYFEVEKAIHRPEQSILGPPRTVRPSKAVLSPVGAEKVLAPLSNSWRMNILLLLSEDSRSLAELSKELGLQKGHLQFHLKALSNADYIHYDRRTHLYSLTERGAIALDGVAELVGRLEQ